MFKPASSRAWSCVLATSLFFGSFAANADMYISGDLGYATPDSELVRASSALGYDVAIGSSLNNWLSLELGYHGMGNFSVSGVEALEDFDAAERGLGLASDFSITGFSASALLSWRPNRWDNFYARLGYMAWENEITVLVRRSEKDAEIPFTLDGQDPLVGLGYAYLIGGDLETSIEYNRYFFGDADVDLLSVGVNYLF